MARTAGNKFGANFSKGIVQETGPLGYPENSVRDMLNVIIERNGSARVREGMVQTRSQLYLDAFATAYDSDNYRDHSRTLHNFPSAGGEANKFLIVQLGPILAAWNVSTEDAVVPILSPRLGYNGAGDIVSVNANVNYMQLFIDLGYCTREELTKSTLKSSSGDGMLFMTSEHTGPFVIKYYPEGISDLLGTVVPSVPSYANYANEECFLLIPITLRYRDFKGVEDGLDVSTRPNTLSSAHRYNLYNQGWSPDRINKFFNGASS